MRLASMFKGDKEKILEAFRMLFLSPGAHIIYYGDEIGMENEKISAGEDVRRVVRGKFDWAMADIEMASSSSLFSNIKNIIAEHAEGK